MTDLTSMTEFMIPQVTSYAKHIHRKSTLEAKIRNLFFHTKRSSRIPPKKEYLRCRLIRGHKRLNRQLSKKSFPIGILNNFDLSDPSATKIWSELENCYNKNQDELDNVSRTESGPKTDGISKRKGKVKNLEKSFNSAFCKRYFSSQAVLESFYFYVELIFLKLEPELLCRKFDFRCCDGEHMPECIEKWLILKKYIRVMMMEELDLLPLKDTECYLSNIFLQEAKDESENEMKNAEENSDTTQSSEILKEQHGTDLDN